MVAGDLGLEEAKVWCTENDLILRVVVSCLDNCLASI